jgi:hypothetical protein
MLIFLFWFCTSTNALCAQRLALQKVKCAHVTTFSHASCGLGVPGSRTSTSSTGDEPLFDRYGNEL